MDPSNVHSGDTPDQRRIDVVEERLRVEKRAVETGRVRISKSIQEREETVDEPLLREEVQVERIPVNRVVDAVPETRQEGETTVIPVVEEVLVRRLVLREEVRITRVRRIEHHPQTVKLKSEHIDVSRTNPQSKGEPGPDVAKG